MRTKVRDLGLVERIHTGDLQTQVRSTSIASTAELPDKRVASKAKVSRHQWGKWQQFQGTSHSSQAKMPESQKVASTAELPVFLPMVVGGVKVLVRTGDKWL